MIVKVKCTDVETANAVNEVAQNCEFALSSIHESFKMDHGFRYSQLLWTAYYSCYNPSVIKILSDKGS